MAVHIYTYTTPPLVPRTIPVWFMFACVHILDIKGHDYGKMFQSPGNSTRVSSGVLLGSYTYGKKARR